MAKQPGLDFQSARGGGGELKKRLLFVLLALIVFRLGSYIPVPGIDTKALSDILSQASSNGIVDMFNMFSGGALSRASIFALGIMPYISASIIVQLLTAINPKLAELKKEGESGRKKISQYTRYGTLALAIVQAVGIATGLPNIPGYERVVTNPGFSFYFIASVSLVTGTMFLMWLGEQITERGVGNGISIIIFSGIVAGLPHAIYETIEQARSGELNPILLLVVAALVIGVTYFVVFVERGQRRIVVNYAQRQQGRRVYAAQTSHLPLKINMAGVIPAIFASTIIMLPSMMASWFQGNGEGWRYVFVLIGQYFSHDQPLYIIFFAAAIIFFCFFYTALVFNPRETADQLKKSGAFIPGIRPGEQTSKYIDKVMTRLTLIGAIYITFVCLVPMFMTSAMKVPVQFGGTSLLIVVVVIMDFMAQVQTLMMPNRYESVLKKANLKGYGR
ncbi:MULTISPECIES: preprotein translocase subunit SecY [unclassified Gilliamella]|uniref:preprotein translocase subunit SecY n=1 Tax=unclassified Gilliamella TaxID=2685620 RepID=UPI00080ECCA5|nr:MULTISPECIES: preprotein translocase subunit SecY [Gilliamella]MCX8574255.1 preprotein translocase subunit SecY [Gilliamella sp. B3831]MCX8576486.1 preprotein translocase subunit SecY [Gilliamella sp. B3815]MCX8577927.1 preprotein translocase subunit SecY [Gilliamella sp. B2717]MCX8587799.1 preprotein translocase subunit SecY [Gilliamella sp. B3801]MCX8590987.1 preprotein translocase subunit SecY [Gilliamella sp. B3812]